MMHLVDEINKMIIIGKLAHFSHDKSDIGDKMKVQMTLQHVKLSHM